MNIFKTMGSAGGIGFDPGGFPDRLVRCDLR
jgi:hypothetical protein